MRYAIEAKWTKLDEKQLKVIEESVVSQLSQRYSAFCEEVRHFVFDLDSSVTILIATIPITSEKGSEITGFVQECFAQHGLTATVRGS